jgi:hypothetical protein
MESTRGRKISGAFHLVRPSTGRGATCWARPSEEGVQRRLRAESQMSARVGMRTLLRGVLDRREVWRASRRCTPSSLCRAWYPPTARLGSRATTNSTTGVRSSKGYRRALVRHNRHQGRSYRTSTVPRLTDAGCTRRRTALPAANGCRAGHRPLAEPSRSTRACAQSTSPVAVNHSRRADC